MKMSNSSATTAALLIVAVLIGTASGVVSVWAAND
jgi:hypothetical protein